MRAETKRKESCNQPPVSSEHPSAQPQTTTMMLHRDSARHRNRKVFPSFGTRKKITNVRARVEKEPEKKTSHGNSLGTGRIGSIFNTRSSKWQSFFFFFIPSPILFPPTNPRPRWGMDVRATYLDGDGYCGSGCCIVAAVFEERALPCFRGNGGTKTKTTARMKRNGRTHSLLGSCLERHRDRKREIESYRDLVFTSFRLLILRPHFHCSTRKKKRERWRLALEFVDASGRGTSPWDRLEAQLRFSLLGPVPQSRDTCTHSRHHSFSSRRSKRDVQLKKEKKNKNAQKGKRKA